MVTPLRAVALSLAMFSACRMEPAPGWSTPAGNAASAAPTGDVDEPAAAGGRGGETSTRGGTGGSGSGTAAGGTAAGSGGTSAKGSGGAQGSATGDEPSGGDGDVPGATTPDGSVDFACGAQTVTFDEVRTGAVRLGARVGVTAVATSQKFLLSHASSGSCLFGAYVGEPAVDGEPRGLLVVSYGDDAPADVPCPTGTDGIPDDLAAGDRLTAAGRFSTYVPSSCDGVAPSPQLLVEAACPLVVASHGESLEAAPLPLELADTVALGTDAALLRRYAGGLVRLDRVSALSAGDGYGVVGPYGVVRFAETRLPLTNDVRYGDLALGGPGSSEKSLRLADPATFVSVTGIVHLDYCAWSLAPRDPCTDLDPAESGCSRPERM